MEENGENDKYLHKIKFDPYKAVEPSSNTFSYSEFGRLGGVYFPDPFRNKIKSFLESPFKTFFSNERRNLIKPHGMACVVHTNEELSEIMVNQPTHYNPKMNVEGNGIERFNVARNSIYSYLLNKSENEYIPPSVMENSIVEDKKYEESKAYFDLFQGSILDSFQHGNQNYLVYVRGSIRNVLAIGNSSKYRGKSIELDAQIDLDETIKRVRCEEFTDEDQVYLLAHSSHKLFLLKVRFEKDFLNLKLINAIQFNSQILDARFPIQSDCYRQEEVIIVCLDGSVHSFNLRSNLGEIETLKNSDIGHQFNSQSPSVNWKSIEYASCPLTNYVAYHDKVLLLDRRVKLLFNFFFFLFFFFIFFIYIFLGLKTNYQHFVEYR